MPKGISWMSCAIAKTSPLYILLESSLMNTDLAAMK